MVRQLGEQALDFVRWYTRSRFHLMRTFLDDLDAAPGARDMPDLRQRYLRALRHGQRVLGARLLVTLLLASSLFAAVLAASLNTLEALPGADVGGTRLLLSRVTAFAGSVTLLLLLLRLAFDRYLELVHTSATFLAIEIATARASMTARD